MSHLPHSSLCPWKVSSFDTEFLGSPVTNLVPSPQSSICRPLSRREKAQTHCSQLALPFPSQSLLKFHLSLRTHPLRRRTTLSPVPLFLVHLLSPSLQYSSLDQCDPGLKLYHSGGIWGRDRSKYHLGPLRLSYGLNSRCVGGLDVHQ